MASRRTGFYPHPHPRPSARYCRVIDVHCHTSWPWFNYLCWCSLEEGPPTGFLFPFLPYTRSKNVSPFSSCCPVSLSSPFPPWYRALFLPITFASPVLPNLSSLVPSSLGPCSLQVKVCRPQCCLTRAPTDAGLPFRVPGTLPVCERKISCPFNHEKNV